MIVADAPALWLPPKPAIIRPATPELLVRSGYLSHVPEHFYAALNELLTSGQIDIVDARKAMLLTPIIGWKTGGRVFEISPAVSGRTLWDLDVHGPMFITTATGSWTFTPSVGFQGVAELWGGGGGGGAHADNDWFSNPGDGEGDTGGDSTFLGMTARGGKGGETPFAGDRAGGAGGTASGGDSNQTGTTGESGQSSYGGAGGAGAGTDGGAGAPRNTASSAAGSTGSAPGGGGSGGTGTANSFDGGGGGGGGKATRTISLAELTAGSPQTLTIAAGGPGAGDGAGTGGNNGGNGARGGARIT